MAFWGGTYTKQVNERGDVFYTYNDSPAGIRSQNNNDDSNNHDEGDGDNDEALADQFADFNLGDADDDAHGHPARGHDIQDSDATRASSISQWDLDNRPIPGAYPEYEGSTSQGIAAPQHGLVTLEAAVEALELPILHATEGYVHFLVVRAVVQFIFNNLPFLDDFRADMPELGDLYDERATELASQFFSDYGVALWGRSADAGDEVNRGRVTRLETLFFVMREHHATRSEVGEDEVETLRELNDLRRRNAHDATPYHTGDNESATPKRSVNLRKTTAAADAAHGLRFDPNADLRELYFALEIQNPDNWVNGAFPRAVAQMAFDELNRIRDAEHSFPCARPSDAAIERIIQRIMARYSRKLWPNSFTQPDEARKILHYYVLALFKTDMKRAEVGGNAVRDLDAFLMRSWGWTTEMPRKKGTARKKLHTNLLVPSVRSRRQLKMRVAWESLLRKLPRWHTWLKCTDGRRKQQTSLLMISEKGPCRYQVVRSIGLSFNTHVHFRGEERGEQSASMHHRIAES